MKKAVKYYIHKLKEENSSFKQDLQNKLFEAKKELVDKNYKIKGFTTRNSYVESLIRKDNIINEQKNDCTL